MLRPFRGVCYNSRIVGDLRTVVAPPYDLITPQYQEELCRRSPYNAVRLILSQEENRYESAARCFTQWLAQGVLVCDREPGLYLYAQKFSTLSGEMQERFGLIAAMRLEDFSSGWVRPHERTGEEAKADRLALLRAIKVNLSPIFGLFSKPDWNIPALCAEQEPPFIDLVDDGGVAHRLWRVTSSEIVREIVAQVAPLPVFIADGHHRYETALRYRDEMRRGMSACSGREPFHFVLMYLTNMEHAGLVILPVHRLVSEMSRPRAEVERELRSSFTVSLFPKSPEGKRAFLAALRSPGLERHIGISMKGETDYWLLAFTSDRVEKLPLPGALRTLDITVLHHMVLNRLGREIPESLAYTIGEEEALHLVDEGRYQAAFLLNPPTVRDIQAVCLAGEVMPEKSTYFYPKLLTGLVFHCLDT